MIEEGKMGTRVRVKGGSLPVRVVRHQGLRRMRVPGETERRVELVRDEVAVFGRPGDRPPSWRRLKRAARRQMIVTRD